MSKPTVTVVVPSFKGADRVRFLLETVTKNDPKAYDARWHVVEDPCGSDYHSEAYDQLSPPARVWHLQEWSNMHGAARKAFDIAMLDNDPDWIIYLGDDLAVTPGALSNLIYFLTENPLEMVGLVQPAYWNAHDLCETVEGEWKGPKLFWTKERDFYASMDWTTKVPRNSYWEKDGKAYSYVNVNGVGFACRASMYREVGGFAEGTWCLDESISVRCWLRSPYSIVALPGPPLVHYFGASTMCGPPLHDLHTEQRWVEAMGMSKEEAGRLSYEKMFEREAAVKAEMATARYWHG